MSKVCDIRDIKDRARRASEWVSLLASGSASAVDRARCDAWLAEDPRHKAAFDAMEDTRSWLVAVGAQSRRAEVRDFHSVAGADSSRRSAITASGRTRVTWMSAAAVVAVIAGGLLLHPLYPKGDLYRTAVGQQSTFTLPDRSTVQLNTNTEILVDYSNDVRTVELRRGEAYFDVAGDTGRPFIVEAGAGSIRAVGTGFVVRVQEEVVKVTVTEGVVEVVRDAYVAQKTPHRGSGTNLAPAAKLGKGQRVEYDRSGTNLAVVAAARLDRDLAWRQGLLIFEDQSLDEVLQEVERYTDKRLIIADSELKHLRVGGAFRSDDLEAVLEFFEVGLDIAVNRDVPDTIYLTAAPPIRID